MTDGFYPMTKWLPTDTLGQRGRKLIRVEIDPDLSLWVEHLKKLGYEEGKDFEIRTRMDGKRCLFRRGDNPFSKPYRPKSRVAELDKYRAKNQESSRKFLTAME